jgi:hypothetical protein
MYDAAFAVFGDTAAACGRVRMKRSSLGFLVVGMFSMMVGCGPSVPGNGDGGGGGVCDSHQCNINGWMECRGGALQPPVACADDEVCIGELGCSVCIPGGRYCVDASIYQCNGEGTGGSLVDICQNNEVCSLGECVTACERAEQERSNIGCEYWAVDLDNEYSQFNDAAGEQFAIAVANASDFPVDVLVEQNDAQVGSSLSLSVVTTAQIPPQSLEVIYLPTREVDGSLMGQDEGPGTMLSSRAYRVTTNYPVVAYQFNPIIQSFSNGASLLIPTSALDDDYWVLGWPTSNPIAPFPLPGIPDHSFVTVVGVTDQPVTVDVTLGGPIVGGGGIPATGAGQVVTAQLKAFDVLNLESDGIPGDMTSTQVHSFGGPVAVFTGGERGSVPYDVMPPPPTDWDGDTCCTEHFEQQAFPTSALGMEFVTTRSPIRSTNVNNPEGDVWRVLATQADTVVTTNLAAPFDSFALTKGEYYEFWSITDFVLKATKPVIVGQFLVSQQYVEWPEVGGDPEFILFPPTEQYREEYIFLAPPTFDRDWCVISAPDTAVVELDGISLNQEFGGPCERYPAGNVAGVDYVALRCPLTDGVHTVKSSDPVGVTVYGYYNVGSYGYAAGAELKRINID